MISVIIVSWNVASDLRRCLESLKGTKDSEVIVIDNNSEDGSGEMVAKEFSDVVLIENNSNRGFAVAANRGIERAKGDIYYMLNPDTRVEPDTLEKLHTFFLSHEKAGIVGTKILHSDGKVQKSVRSFPTLLSQVFILLKIHNFLPRLQPLRQYFRRDFDYTKEEEVDQVMGASFAVRKACLDQIGSFDEGFWIWFEEVDLCKRAHDAGWKVYYTPGTVVHHEKGKSFAQVSRTTRQVWLHRSMYHYFEKHQPLYERLILLFVFPTALVLASLSSLILRFKSKDRDL